VVFNNSNWDFLSLDFDKDVSLADKLDKGLIGATDPNLKEFFAHGGKLIMYHGWNAQLITPLNSIDYFNTVAAKIGGVAKIDGSFRLFMVPAMNHCSGGDGPSRFDTVAALEHWVEQGKAPDRMLASHVSAGNQVDRTRPLCPYPQVARYTGTGSRDATPISPAFGTISRKRGLERSCAAPRFEPILVGSSASRKKAASRKLT
jgi:feruloyl esterase